VRGDQARSLVSFYIVQEVEAVLTLGFPKRFFIASVIKKVAASDRASPSQPECNSHNFLLQIKDVGVDFGTVGPGTSSSVTRHIMTIGITRSQITSTVVDIFSLCTYGKLMLGSMRENGRLFGVIPFKMPPIAAKIATTTQSKTYDSMTVVDRRPGCF
jgi:hypothetical protein